MNLYFIQNGMYIPFFQILFFNYTENMLLTFLLGTRLYTINYYYWFGDRITALPRNNNYNLIKQFIRFTDTGHLISLLYYFDNNYYSMAVNIHFIITFGFWIGKFFNIDCDDVPISNNLNKSIVNLHSTINHSIHLIILIYHYNNHDKNNLFTNKDLYMTFLWLYIWFIFVYMPWRYITGDVVYGFFDNNYPLNKTIIYVSIIHIIIYISNTFGYYLKFIY